MIKQIFLSTQQVKNRFTIIGFHFNTKYFIDTHIEMNNLIFYKNILFFMAYQLNKGKKIKMEKKLWQSFIYLEF